MFSDGWRSRSSLPPSFSAGAPVNPCKHRHDKWLWIVLVWSVYSRRPRRVHLPRYPSNWYGSSTLLASVLTPPSIPWKPGFPSFKAAICMDCPEGSGEAGPPPVLIRSYLCLAASDDKFDHFFWHALASRYIPPTVEMVEAILSQQSCLILCAYASPPKKI